jgi:hypothetical protein
MKPTMIINVTTIGVISPIENPLFIYSESFIIPSELGWELQIKILEKIPFGLI